MNTNFDFLAKNKEFLSFARQAIEAERSLTISPATAAILSRRALELAVRWVYINENALHLPYRDNLSSLIHEDSFQRIIEPGLFPMLKFIVKLGNTAVHTNKNIRRDDAVLSLRDLFEFCKWIEYCYGKEYEDVSYDESILEQGEGKKVRQAELKKLYGQLSSKDRKLEEMRQENESLRGQMSELRRQNVSDRTFEIDKTSEAETRKKYIDLDLMEAGWQIGRIVWRRLKSKGCRIVLASGMRIMCSIATMGFPLLWSRQRGRRRIRSRAASRRSCMRTVFRINISRDH